MRVDPNKRITAYEALHHSWIKVALAGKNLEILEASVRRISAQLELKKKS